MSDENMVRKDCTWPPPTLGAWLKEVKEEAPPRWYIDGVIPCDAVGIISAQPKTFKTYFAMQVSRMLSCGQTVSKALPLPQDFKPLKVWFMEFEGSRGVNYDNWTMLENGCSWKANLDNIYWMHRYRHFKLNDPACVQAAQDFVAREGISLVFVNTFAEARGYNGDENDQRTVGEALDALRTIQQATPNGLGSVFYVHHCRKLSDDEDDNIAQDVRGSSALVAGYDHHLGFRKSPDQNSLYLITNGKGDYDRYYSVKWEIDKKIMKAHLDMSEWNLHDQFDFGQLDGWAHKLVSKKVYNEGELRSVWGAPRPVVRAIVRQLLGTEQIVRTAKGIALSEGGGE